jgi:hypothetical protein
MPKPLASQTSVILKDLKMKLDRVSMEMTPLVNFKLTTPGKFQGYS